MVVHSIIMYCTWFPTEMCVTVSVRIGSCFGQELMA